jgi:hypothetical protein
LKQADALHKTIKGKLLIQVSEDTLVSWGNRHQQSSNGRTDGVPIQQEYKDPKSLSPHKDQYPGEIRIKSTPETPIKGGKKERKRGRNTERKTERSSRGTPPKKLVLDSTMHFPSTVHFPLKI